MFRKFAFSANVSSLVSSLCYKRPAVIQSMYIFKVPCVVSSFFLVLKLVFRIELISLQFSNQALVVRWCRIRTTHSYIQSLHRAQGCGLHSKMQLKLMAVFGQFLDHIKVDFPTKLLFNVRNHFCGYLSFWLSFAMQARWSEKANDQRWKWYSFWSSFTNLWSERICAIRSKVGCFGGYSWRSYTSEVKLPILVCFLIATNCFIFLLMCSSFSSTALRIFLQCQGMHWVYM